MTLAWLFMLLFAGHLLVAGAVLPMAQRCLPPNRWRGVRTPVTVADEGIWYEANAVAGKTLLGATAVSGLATALLFNLFPAVTATVFALGFFAVAEGVAVLLSLAALRRKGVFPRP